MEQWSEWLVGIRRYVAVSGQICVRWGFLSVVGGRPPSRPGKWHPNHGGYMSWYRCSDGWIFTILITPGVCAVI